MLPSTRTWNAKAVNNPNNVLVLSEIIADPVGSGTFVVINKAGLGRARKKKDIADEYAYDSTD
jgi:hypothetical protein